MITLMSNVLQLHQFKTKTHITPETHFRRTVQMFHTGTLCNSVLTCCVVSVREAADRPTRSQQQERGELSGEGRSL